MLRGISEENDTPIWFIAPPISCVVFWVCTLLACIGEGGFQVSEIALSAFYDGS